MSSKKKSSKKKGKPQPEPEPELDSEQDDFAQAYHDKMLAPDPALVAASKAAKKNPVVHKQQMWIDNTSDSSWVGTLRADGHTIEMGPTQFTKSKPSKKRGGRVKDENRYLVLTFKKSSIGLRRYLVYHSGDAGRDLDMDKMALPLDPDTWINMDDHHGKFLVEVSEKRNPGHRKAGVIVTFLSRMETAEARATEVQEWVAAIKNVMKGARAAPKRAALAQGGEDEDEEET